MCFLKQRDVFLRPLRLRLHRERDDNRGVWGLASGLHGITGVLELPNHRVVFTEPDTPEEELPARCPMSTRRLPSEDRHGARGLYGRRLDRRTDTQPLGVDLVIPLYGLVALVHPRPQSRDPVVVHEVSVTAHRRSSTTVTLHDGVSPLPVGREKSNRLGVEVSDLKRSPVVLQRLMPVKVGLNQRAALIAL